ncbi:polysaccharide biosynthesis/export family protein [Coralloluteibacterium stylophorae]|uniref:Polysaccharide biosynthesis/export family protein n=1 Tax=Coralloluteibacterium stylophorae TaxID=1776034 RepID=A0A8J7VQQ3_9GAMM|nr:polysaccharide biosynthesis/export family protein [Coralloluteibacterium stylophorae]MBS7458085.1 polysaccharide biosynthesis/export family protein [Coralloluteibacterium stylophorae]
MYRRILFALLALLALATLGGCASSAGGGGMRPVASGGESSFRPPDSIADSGAYTGVSDYRIGPLDLIRISVFQVPDMQRSVRVNSSGMVTLPLIGTVQAGGRTVLELEAEIGRKLEEAYLQNPQVTVFVEEFTSQRVTVEGAVNKPGIYPLTGQTTLLQAIAMSEGLDELADPGAVVVFRTIGGEKKAALFDLEGIRSGAVADPLIYGDDIVVVDRSGSRSFIKEITDTLRGFIGFERY